MPIDNKFIDIPLKDSKTPGEILGDNGLTKRLTKAVLERAMQAELTEHLGYTSRAAAAHNPGHAAAPAARWRISVRAASSSTGAEK